MKITTQKQIDAEFEKAQKNLERANLEFLDLPVWYRETKVRQCMQAFKTAWIRKSVFEPDLKKQYAELALGDFCEPIESVKRR